MIVNQTEKRKKKIALVANSTWSVYNFRIDLIRHLIPRFRCAGDRTEGCFRRRTGKSRLFCTCIFNSTTVPKIPCVTILCTNRSKRIYQAEKPDFIFHYVIKPNIYGSLAASACGISSVAVITGLGYTFDRQNWLNRIVSFLYRRSLKKASEVWFLNQEDAEVFIRRKLVAAGEN